MYRSLTILSTVAEYQALYEQTYCNATITTHDGYIVKFNSSNFDHAFYCNANRRTGDKSIFSDERAQRMLWIKEVLKDPNVTLYAGWDTTRKRYDHTRRVCLVTEDNYVVVLRVIKANETFSFVTAYLIDNEGVAAKIKSSPLWNS